MGKLTCSSYLREQWTAVPIPIPTADISDKSIVITGSNVGLGFEAAVHLANLNPKRLLLTARDDAKCNQTKQDVERQATTTRGAVDAWPLELNSFDSVRNFADRVASEDLPINALIANAGMLTLTYARTQDKWETTLQVNYLSTALLSILMLPHLVKSATPTNASRLVIVSSVAHYYSSARLKGAAKWPSILGKLNDEGYCTTAIMQRRYEVTKMLEIMFVRELAARLPDPTPVAVSAINPGFCHSHLTRTIDRNPIIYAMLYVMKALTARTTEAGSRTLVHSAVAPGERARHGRYVSSCEVAEESNFILSEEGKDVSRRLWLTCLKTETVQILVQVDPRVNQIISEHLLAR